MKYLLDKASLADFCDISTNTVDAWIDAGRLPKGRLMGGKLMWRRADVEGKLDVIFEAQPTEAALAERIRHATKRALNAG